MAEHPKSGGTLTMVLAADPPGLDTVQLQGVQNWAEAVAVAAIYDALFYPDATGRLQPKMGRSITSSDGGKTWEVKLTPGIRFSDGTPLDSEALRFNWARLADPDNQAAAGRFAAMIERMDSVDAETLRVTLSAANPRWDMLVARYLSTLASPAAEGEPVGAGPFMLAEWERGQQMRLVRNPGYWQAGKPYLHEVVVITGLTDAAPKYEAVTSGRAQVALEPLGTNVAKYRQQPDRYDLLTTPQTGGGVALALNLSRLPFDDIRMRRALSLVLDSAQFVEGAGYGDPGMVMTTIDRAGTPFSDPDIRLPQRDAAQAQTLIDAIVAETGGPVRFTVETFANEGHIREANTVKQIVEAQLRDVEVTVSVGTVAELMAKWRSGEFDASNHAVGWSDPGLDLPASFASASPMNIMRYRNDAVDAALQRFATATDEAAVVRLHREVLRQVQRDLPVIFLSHKEAFHIADRQAVRDWKLFYSLRPLIEDAWLV